MPSCLWLKNPSGVFTANNEDAAGGLVVEGRTILELIPNGGQPSISVDATVDLSHCVMTPGLINTHHHFYQTLTRCLPEAINKPLFPWLQTLYKVWQKITPEMLASASRLAALELMHSGATTLGDHHYVYSEGLTEAVDIQIDALATTKARLQLTRGSMSLGQSCGGLPPDSVIQDEATILADCEDIIKRHHQTGPGAMLQIALAPCSPFSVSEALMRETAKLAQHYNVLTHTHLAETEDENAFCQRQFGMRPLDYLEQCGWLHRNTWLAHGIYFNRDEIQRLGKAGVGIAHCPSSNMLLASGICPTLDLQAAGCSIGLAVDGSASNDSSNLIQEVRQSLLQQRLKYGAERVTAETVLRFATAGGAGLYHRNDIGQLAPGYQADIAIFKLDEMRFSGVGDAVAALVTCGAHQVDRLMIGGQWVIEDGMHCTIDKQETIAEHQHLAKTLRQLAD